MNEEAKLMCLEGMCEFAHKCHLGHEKMEECPVHIEINAHVEQQKPEVEPLVEEERGVSIPWPGSAYSQSNLHHLSVQQRPTLIGVMGLVNAGKTSFLGSIYGLLLRGASLKGFTWGGSDTLVGWEVLASNMRWRPDFFPGFPPHTPRGGRVPGLLHLKFRADDGSWRELLFTDAAGEWFAHWAVHEQDTLAESARWVAKHMDMALFFIDSEALMVNPSAETFRIKQLLMRLKDHLRGRPLLVVWAKHDLLQENRHTERLRNHIDTQFPGVLQQVTQALADVKGPGTGVLNSLDWVLQNANIQTPGKPIEPHLSSSNPFMWYRETHRE